MAEVIIRPVNTGDTDAIAEMWLDLVAFHQKLSPDLPGAVRGAQHRYVRRIMERLEDHYTCALVAELDTGAIARFPV